MAYTITSNEVIDYKPDALRSFFVYGFEWIDNLLFLQNPKSFLGSRAMEYETIARERFAACGWQGDGDIQLLWLPSFVFPLILNIQPTGVTVWHVKQVEDGVSFLLSPIELPFPEFSGAQQ